jgi:hypothetical protein
MKIKVRLISLFAVVAFLIASPALAADCKVEIAALDQAIADLNSDNAPLLAELYFLRGEAASACSAGDNDTALHFVREAKDVAGLQ